MSATARTAGSRVSAADQDREVLEWQIVADFVVRGPGNPREYLIDIDLGF